MEKISKEQFHAVINTLAYFESNDTLTWVDFKIMELDGHTPDVWYERWCEHTFFDFYRMMDDGNQEKFTNFLLSAMPRFKKLAC